MDKINTLKIFTLVAKTQSFAGAAKALGTDPSTISKAVQRLEQELGIALFQRTTRQIKITQAGQVYLAQVQRSLGELSSCEEALREENTEVTGKLKVNLPVSYGRLYVQPLIPEFIARYPKLKVELNYDDNFVDIIEHGFDVSVRSGRLQDKRIIAQQLSSMDFVCCAAPGFLKKHGITRLDNIHFPLLPWVQFRFKQSGKLMPIMALTDQGIVDVELEPSIIVDDGEAMAELSALELGLVQCPHFIARNHLLNGRLVPVYPTITTPDSGVYVLYANRAFLPKRVRCFIEFLKEKISAMDEGPNGTWALKLECESGA